MIMYYAYVGHTVRESSYKTTTQILMEDIWFDCQNLIWINGSDLRIV